MGGINEVKLGVAYGYYAAPIIYVTKKKPLSLGGLNETKLGQCDGYHAAPISVDRKSPRRWGE